MLPLHLLSLRFRTLPAAVVLVAALSGLSPADAQDHLHFNQTLKISDVGDGLFTIHMKFNAQQWQMWQQRYGMNPALFRRDMIRSLSQYSIADFKLERNDMEREVTVTLHAHGVTRYRGQGIFETEIPKTWRLINQQGGELKFSYVESAGNTTIHHHIVAYLPEQATSISTLQPGDGQANSITYRLPLSTASDLPLWSGIGLITTGLLITLLGLATLLFSLLIGGRRTH